ncbi:hypothetical protein K3722_11810 [Leisingera caerulea]|uniref:Uncharacterized protein n=1 Tax=Leisingera caerulea TaxID=506591 RepID=A0ABY5WSC3_LEICA|nr:hypothetical protein [Leisingera caerulea]UWQ57216.1 hypothetical protein K3722_11810 [Leisingera caerulea]
MAYTKPTAVAVRGLASIGILAGLSAPLLELSGFEFSKPLNVSSQSWLSALVSSLFVLNWMASAEDNPHVRKSGVWIVGITGFTALMIVIATVAKALR